MSLNQTIDSRVKDLPEDEKPYEKFLKLGPKALSDSELLAIIIKTGTRGQHSIQVARSILHQSKGSKGLLGITTMTMSELQKVKGIGRVKAIQIKCIVELSARISRQKAEIKVKFTSPEAIADYYMEEMRHKEREELLICILDTKNHLLHDEILFTGTVNSSLISPREIFLKALEWKAVSIVLLHNHPSGDPTPSQEDMVVTQKIKNAGELVGISLLDHIIIGQKDYASFREKGLI